MLWQEEKHNLITAEGLTQMLQGAFHGVTQITPWYVVAYQNNYSPSTADTYAVPGFTEFNNYAEATRPEYVEQVLSYNELSNDDVPASFTVTGNLTIYGGALLGGGSSPAVKRDISGGGKMYASIKLAVPRIVSPGNVLQIVIYLSLSGA
jgi:hypothetical protein